LISFAIQLTSLIYRLAAEKQRHGPKQTFSVFKFECFTSAKGLMKWEPVFFNFRR
jgi:hypothetical protein